MADELDILGQAAVGLVYPSEADAPFAPFRFAGNDAGSARQVIANHAPGAARIREQTPDDFFAELIASEDGERYRTLRHLLELKLASLQIFRVGAIEVEIYLIGRTTGGDWAGLRTTSVET